MMLPVFTSELISHNHVSNYPLVGGKRTKVSNSNEQAIHCLHMYCRKVFCVFEEGERRRGGGEWGVHSKSVERPKFSLLHKSSRIITALLMKLVSSLNIEKVCLIRQATNLLTNDYNFNKKYHLQ